MAKQESSHSCWTPVWVLSAPTSRTPAPLQTFRSAQEKIYTPLGSIVMLRWEIFLLLFKKLSVDPPKQDVPKQMSSDLSSQTKRYPRRSSWSRGSQPIVNPAQGSWDPKVAMVQPFWRVIWQNILMKKSSFLASYEISDQCSLKRWHTQAGQLKVI